MRPGLRLPSRGHAASAASVALLAGAAAYVVLLVARIGGDGYDQLRDVYFYNGLLAASALFCLARPLVLPGARLAWTLIGVGLAFWVIGDLYYEVAFANADEVPFPSVADAFYLAFYPPVYAGLALLLRTRLQDIRGDLWVDGLIAGLTIAAVGAAMVFGVVVQGTGDAWAFWTNLAYPAADLALIGMVIAVIAMTGWSLDRAWTCILLGCLVFGVSDTAYLYATASETYSEGSLMDAGWVAGIALIAVAAWQPRRPVVAVRVDGFWAFALPTVFGSGALALLVYDHFSTVNTIALVLATLAVAAVIVRMALTFHRNAHLLETSRRDAETDALTGLANRRRLLLDLENRINVGAPTLLLLFDLDGFKSYNDAFGHPAGDALLHRLAMRLGEAAEPYGRAYRMGGDEFCVIADGPASVDRGQVVSATLRALRDEGEGFAISSAYGAAILPDEATELSEAMRIADTRLYGNKDSRRASAGRQTREVLLSVLGERDAELRGHLSAVAQLARAVGERLQLPDADLHDLTLAAELHDVGKLAVPDSILSKQGALTEDEWVFIHRHTVIGERILSSAPALARISRIVRSTHERLDGTGYPDNLSGDQIPLLSRIVSACDAFHAMIEDRPYRPALTEADAVAELRRCSGSQFDPAVVEALVGARRELGLPLVA